jgi:hypothetical protein
MTHLHHDLQPGEPVSIEKLTILRKHQFEQAARGHTDAVQTDPAHEPAAAPTAEVRKAKQPGNHRLPAAPALAER